MKMKVQITIALLCSILFILSCNNNPSPSPSGKEGDGLSLADSLMRTRPDSALKILYSLTPEYKPSPSGELEGGHRYYLLLLNAQNKCDTVFRSDTLQQALVRHYDRHGTPNERMLAYYLLGRACHDMGEAPRALDCYQQAIECADTTSNDCDYSLLSRVYSQRGELFHSQKLYKKQIDEFLHATRYAWKAKDTLVAIRCYDYCFSGYYQLKQFKQAEDVQKKVYAQYSDFGYKRQAARTLSDAILLYVTQEKWEEARKCINEFERESGLFDGNNDIKKGHELYYYKKGQYYLGIGKIDSAEIVFRKILYRDCKLNERTAAYKGLMSVYQHKHVSDSIGKYAALYCLSNDSTVIEDATQELAHMSALYDYSRHQRAAAEAERKLEKSKREKTLLLILSFIVIGLTVGIGLYQYHKEKRRNLRRINALARSYTSMVDELHLRRLEMRLLADDQALMSERQVQIDDYQRQIDRLMAQLHEKSEKELANAFFSSDIYELLKTVLSPSKESAHKKMSRRDWQEFERIFHVHFPKYSSFLREHHLTDSQSQVCMLIRIDFSEGEMGLLMEKGSDAINRIKTQINRKLFNDKYSKTLRSNLKPYY